MDKQFTVKLTYFKYSQIGLLEDYGGYLTYQILAYLRYSNIILIDIAVFFLFRVGQLQCIQLQIHLEDYDVVPDPELCKYL